MSEDKSKLQLIGEIAQANNKNLELIEELNDREEEIERLNKEVEKYKKRCYEALTLIRENYGLLDKYGIDMLDDILNGK